VIQIQGLKKMLNETRVLDGVDLDIPEGKAMVIMGPSGTGKSVLLKHIVGLLDPDAGDLLVDGMSVPRANARQIHEIRGKISYVFQNSALFDSLTVGENIRLGLTEEYCRKAGSACMDIILRAIDHVNLDPAVANLVPAELSGGMQKRVAIARALVGEQKYILYDEPTTGLDPVNASVINQLIARLHREIGKTSIIVTHDVESAFFLADSIALLSDGRVQALGTPGEFRESTDPIVANFLRTGAHMAGVA
jgi:phospholipid/cholesterol/gamma-HCH transport system ATP-binding protein